jgi:hypothetical protein
MTSGARPRPVVGVGMSIVPASQIRLFTSSRECSLERQDGGEIVPAQGQIFSFSPEGVKTTDRRGRQVLAHLHLVSPITREPIDIRYDAFRK